LPILQFVQERGRRSATTAVIQATAVGIDNHHGSTLTVKGVGGFRVYRLWDVNGDGILDGDPVREAPLLTAEGHRPIRQKSWSRCIAACCRWRN
jgi:hypothetical protein